MNRRFRLVLLKISESGDRTLDVPVLDLEYDETDLVKSKTLTAWATKVRNAVRLTKPKDAKDAF
jgi:hypothetical protein